MTVKYNIEEWIIDIELDEGYVQSLPNPYKKSLIETVVEEIIPLIPTPKDWEKWEKWEKWEPW
jgi:hypothetical protein